MCACQPPESAAWTVCLGLWPWVLDAPPRRDAAHTFLAQHQGPPRHSHSLYPHHPRRFPTFFAVVFYLISRRLLLHTPKCCDKFPIDPPQPHRLACSPLSLRLATPTCPGSARPRCRQARAARPALRPFGIARAPLPPAWRTAPRHRRHYLLRPARVGDGEARTPHRLTRRPAPTRARLTTRMQREPEELSKLPLGSLVNTVRATR